MVGEYDRGEVRDGSERRGGSDPAVGTPSEGGRQAGEVRPPGDCRRHSIRGPVQGAFGGYCRTTFPPVEPVFKYFTAREEGRRLEGDLMTNCAATFGEAEGRVRYPSAGIMDSQSVKTTERGPRGYDAGKKNLWTQETHPRRRARSRPGGRQFIPRTFRIVTARSSCSPVSPTPSCACATSGRTQATPDSLSSGYETLRGDFRPIELEIETYPDVTSVASVLVCCWVVEHLGWLGRFRRIVVRLRVSHFHQRGHDSHRHDRRHASTPRINGFFNRLLASY